MGGEKSERQRKCDGERGSRDRHRERISQRPQPAMVAFEIRRKHFAGELLDRRPGIGETPRIEQASKRHRGDNQNDDKENGDTALDMRGASRARTAS